MRKNQYGIKLFVNLLVLLILELFYGSIHSQRQEFTINSSWQFALDRETGKSQVVNLPHTWNALDAFIGDGQYYRGKGTYEKKLFIPDEWIGQRLFIRFEAANQDTKMWVNGKFAGEHQGGYTGFIFDLTDHIRFGEENTLKIEVDNCHNPDLPGF